MNPARLNWAVPWAGVAGARLIAGVGEGTPTSAAPPEGSGSASLVGCRSMKWPRPGLPARGASLPDPCDLILPQDCFQSHVAPLRPVLLGRLLRFSAPSHQPPFPPPCLASFPGPISFLGRIPEVHEGFLGSRVCEQQFTRIDSFQPHGNSTSWVLV